MQGTAQKKAVATGDFDLEAGLMLDLADEQIFLHAAGVAVLPVHETLIVADLHFEKGSSFATRQIFLPPYDTSATLSLLSDVIDAFRPGRVIALGDSFHDEGGPSRMGSDDQAQLEQLVACVDWIWVAGNHDPTLPVSLGGSFTDHVKVGSLSLRHEPTVDCDPGEVAGHFHPCAKIRGRGRSVRKRCFVANHDRLVLPSFGAFTGGLNVLDEAFHPIFPDARFHAYMMGSEKLFPIPPSSCLPG